MAQPDPVTPAEAGAPRAFSTRAVHDAVTPAVLQRPTSVPIYQTSTWGFESSSEYASVLAGDMPGHSYGRGYGNPTVEAFEAVMASLEETEAAFGYSSGMSAIHALVVSLARAGDRIVASNEIYGGTFALFTHVLPRYGIIVDWVDPHDLDAVTAALGNGAALLYFETIGNPRCRVADLPALAALARSAGVASAVDNTFASPYLLNPASLGVDFVVHSATKYIGGHSDLIAGVVCCSDEGRRALRSTSVDVGGAMQPLEAWLCVRGIQTLELRMKQQSGSARALAEALARHPRVLTVHYPGIPDHPDHERATQLLRSGMCGGTLAFEVDGVVEDVARVCESLELGWLGASLGGTHTLVTHPASTTHRQLDDESRRRAGVAEGLVRVSVGLEDPADIIADFEQALDRH